MTKIMNLLVCFSQLAFSELCIAARFCHFGIDGIRSFGKILTRIISMLLHIGNGPGHLLQIGNFYFLRISAALLGFYTGLQVNHKAQIGLDEQYGHRMLFDLEEAIMFTPKPQEYADPLTGEMKKKQIKFFPDVYKDRIGKSYNDYIAGHQMNLFEDFIGYQGSAVLDEPEQKTDTISVPIPQCEESENIPLSDFPEQPENVQRPGSEVIEKGMLT